MTRGIEGQLSRYVTWPLVVALLLLTPGVAGALEIELRDVAPDRLERQRAHARGLVPLPGTPDMGRLEQRLTDKGLAKGNAIFIRIFKETSELEVWLLHDKEKRFVLLDTYPICHWTGSLGPKIREGDRQSPEGFYAVRWQQTRLVGRWRKAFNLGFPNAFDQLNRRTGSYLLVHGGCSSVGCYAMTDAVQEEIFELAMAAIAKGQKRFHVHVFPFRMTEENLERHGHRLWKDFWLDLKVGYDSFERTRLPPQVGICEQRYQVMDGEPADEGDPDFLTLLRPQASAADLGGAWKAPACPTGLERTRLARQSSAAGDGDAEQAQQRKPRKVKAGQPGGSSASAVPRDDAGDAGHGARPFPGSPRVVSNGG